MTYPVRTWILLAGLSVFQSILLTHAQETRSGIYFGEAPPGGSAQLFAPGFASTQHHDDMYPVYSPDGREVVLRINGKIGDEIIALLYLTRMDESGVWSSPRPLPFLTRHMNGGASFTPDGSRIYFTTRRPLAGEDEADAHSRLWYADRADEGWGEARPVETPINEFDLNGGCFLAADGTFYASFVGPNGDSHDIYELKAIDGAYPEFHPLPGAVNSSDMEVAPFVNPDEGYMLFTSVAEEGVRIKISFLDSDGRWAAPEVVDELTEPQAKFVRTSPDGKYLFFVSHRQTDRSNPPADWTIDAFDAPAIERCADIWWMNAAFLNDRIGAHQVRKALLEQYIEGLRTREFELIESICLPGTVLQGALWDGTLRTTDLSTWSERFTPGEPPFESLTWEIGKIDVRGHAAQARIDFVLDGDRPVTDYLNLVKVEGRWRVANIIDY